MFKITTLFDWRGFALKSLLYQQLINLYKTTVYIIKLLIIEYKIN